MRLRVGAATDPGRVRATNEDVFVARARQGLFVVCDGMGGCPAGDVASRMAADAIVEALDAVERPTQVRGDGAYRAQTSRLADAVRRSNEIIYDHARKDPRRAGMGTTMVGAWISDQIASVAHVGDSRAYLWHGQCLEPLTRDHSLAEIGHDNVLVRVLGRKPDVDVDLNEVPVVGGDYLVLCSDGLTRMVPDAAVADAILETREPQAICTRLIEAANRNGGSDNITLVVVEVQGRWWRRAAARWAARTGGGRHGHAGSAG
jgi:PPM family protein phosphatase